MADPMNFINELLEKFKFKIMLFIYCYTLFTDSVSNWNNIWLDETEWWLKKDLEGIVHSLQGLTVK